MNLAVQKRPESGLARLLAAPWGGPTAYVLPAPRVAPERLFDCEDPSVFWEPADGVAVAGSGLAWRATAEGPDRLRALAGEAERVLSSIELAPLEGAPPLLPRAFVGASFEDRVQGPWSAFGAAEVSIPRWTYWPGALMLVLLEPTSPESLLLQYHRLLEALERPLEKGPVLLGPAQGDAAAFVQGVQALKEAIVQGRLNKAVLSRRLVARGRINAREVLGRLPLDGPGSVRFAFRRKDHVFLGATPELLVARQGLRVMAQALAGTAPGAEARQDPQVLLDSAKDRAEHEYVVKHVLERLGPHSVWLEAPPSPGVRHLRHVAHLETPVRGLLNNPWHLLSLGAALHPTPAVGGEPLAEARALIGAHEPTPRGWYTGAVGWCDKNGDGELWVALRSALLGPEDATIFVGGGIVRDSDPARELAETEWKARGMLAALGASS